jgi:hypothetical protein
VPGGLKPLLSRRVDRVRQCSSTAGTMPRFAYTSVRQQVTAAETNPLAPAAAAGCTLGRSTAGDEFAFSQLSNMSASDRRYVHGPDAPMQLAQPGSHGADAPHAMWTSGVSNSGRRVAAEPRLCNQGAPHPQHVQSSAPAASECIIHSALKCSSWDAGDRYQQDHQVHQSGGAASDQRGTPTRSSTAGERPYGRHHHHLAAGAQPQCLAALAAPGTCPLTERAREEFALCSEPEYASLLARLSGVLPTARAVDQLFGRGELRQITTRHGLARLLRADASKGAYVAAVTQLLTGGQLHVPPLAVRSGQPSHLLAQPASGTSNGGGLGRLVSDVNGSSSQEQGGAVQFPRCSRVHLAPLPTSRTSEAAGRRHPPAVHVASSRMPPGFVSPMEDGAGDLHFATSGNLGGWDEGEDCEAEHATFMGSSSGQRRSALSQDQPLPAHSRPSRAAAWAAARHHQLCVPASPMEDCASTLAPSSASGCASASAVLDDPGAVVAAGSARAGSSGCAVAGGRHRQHAALPSAQPFHLRSGGGGASSALGQPASTAGDASGSPFQQVSYADLDDELEDEEGSSGRPSTGAKQLASSNMGGSRLARRTPLTAREATSAPAAPVLTTGAARPVPRTTGAVEPHPVRGLQLNTTRPTVGTRVGSGPAQRGVLAIAAPALPLPRAPRSKGQLLRDFDTTAALDGYYVDSDEVDVRLSTSESSANSSSSSSARSSARGPRKRASLVGSATGSASESAAPAGPAVESLAPHATAAASQPPVGATSAGGPGRQRLVQAAAARKRPGEESHAVPPGSSNNADSAGIKRPAKVARRKRGDVATQTSPSLADKFRWTTGTQTTISSAFQRNADAQTEYVSSCGVIMPALPLQSVTDCASINVNEQACGSSAPASLPLARTRLQACTGLVPVCLRADANGLATASSELPSLSNAMPPGAGQPNRIGALAVPGSRASAVGVGRGLGLALAGANDTDEEDEDEDAAWAEAVSRGLCGAVLLDSQSEADGVEDAMRPLKVPSGTSAVHDRAAVVRNCASQQECGEARAEFSGRDGTPTHAAVTPRCDSTMDGASGGDIADVGLGAVLAT